MKSYSARSLFVGRGAFDTGLWIFCLLMAVVAVGRAVRTGSGWGSAIGVTVMAIAYTFLPWLREMQRARAQKRVGTLTIDDWGVARVAEGLREAVAWKDLVWVRIYTTSAGPGADDVYFALAGADGKGCLVPHGLAVKSNLLAVLQERLPDLDNGQVAIAMGSSDDAYFTIWKRPAPGGAPAPRPN